MERKVSAYKNYFLDFIDSLTELESRKVFYAIDMLKTQTRLSEKFIKHLGDGLFELRIEYNSNIYRVFLFSTKAILYYFSTDFRRKVRKLHVLRLKKQED